MAVQVSDPIIVALITLSGSALTGLLSWIALRHKREANLLDKAMAQVVVILNQREMQVDDLKTEVAQLRDRVGALVETLRGVFRAGEHCPHKHEGECPIAHVEIAGAVSEMFVRPN